jgi:hypothetical protein
MAENTPLVSITNYQPESILRNVIAVCSNKSPPLGKILLLLMHCKFLSLYSVGGG